ncbi:hypothetical protein C8F04DRAFT_1252266 [Mycena alexandri]|uniref:Uncharacterized protein n=1 Tax=Mycena alexandri TaxID=1745969 RepID=A0AAD6XEH2_9AGAR|nr:hypothetical protein C8F04DRAFT_1252266 [Mycena alexandri]
MSSASYASLVGLAVLENPRKISEKGLTLAFDATWYLGASDREAIVGSLRYFNSKSDKYPEVGLYFVYTTVSHMDLAIEVHTGGESGSELTPADYNVVGDIQFLTYLGHPAETEIDFRQRPYAHICGAAFNIDVPTATFSVTAEQYTSAFRELQKKTPGAPKSTFSAVLTIQNSPRYEVAKKPVPYKNRFVMATGYVTGITSKFDNAKVVDSFHIDVENVAFLGMNGVTQPAVPSTPALGTPGSAGKVKSGVNKRWNFDTPVNAAKRRKTLDDDEGAGVGDSSGAGPSSPAPSSAAPSSPSPAPPTQF